MASEQELIAIRVALKNAQAAVRDAHRVAAGIDEIGDEAEQMSRKADKAARSITRLNAANTSTRVNLGPFSIKLKYAGLVIGGVVIAAEKLTPAVLSAAEAVATLAGGAGAAGGVGLLALKQASVVAKLGVSDLTDALAGNEEAARNLSPEAYELFRTLSDGRDRLKDTASTAMFPGLDRGGNAAIRNLSVINRLVRGTGKELGRLAGDAGEALGSDAWGRDIATVGKSNVRIIGDLGDAGGNLANVLRHIVVEAGPLTEWLAMNAEQGSASAEAWAEQARKGGDLRRFFQESRTDMRLFADATGDVTQGIGNLFGNQDVSGTGFLRDLEAATQRFEDWTNSPAVRHDFGAAIRKEVADGVGAAAGAAAETLPLAAARAAEVFWQSFWAADPEAKALIAGLTGAKIAGAIRGTRALPMWVRFADSVPGDGGKDKRKPPVVIPPWVKGVGAAALRSGGVAALPAGMIAALLFGNNHDYPSGSGEGATRHGRERQGRPARDNRGAFERVADPGERGLIDTLPSSPVSRPIEVHSKIDLDGEPIFRGITGREGRRNARKR